MAGGGNWPVATLASKADRLSLNREQMSAAEAMLMESR